MLATRCQRISLSLSLSHTHTHTHTLTRRHRCAESEQIPPLRCQLRGVQNVGSCTRSVHNLGIRSVTVITAVSVPRKAWTHEPDGAASSEQKAGENAAECYQSGSSSLLYRVDFVSSLGGGSLYEINGRTFASTWKSASPISKLSLPHRTAAGGFRSSLLQHKHKPLLTKEVGLFPAAHIWRHQRECWRQT